MEFSVTISKSFSEGDLNYLFTDSDMRQIQNSMAIPLADICVNNLGYEGQDRPSEWPILSKGYANAYHDGDRTPTLELYGNLREAIQIDPSNGEYSRVFCDSGMAPYAADHQWGLNGQKKRPFFPLIGDESSSVLTPFAESEVTNAAAMEVERILGK